MSDLKTLAEQSLWKAESGLKALPDAIKQGAKAIGASKRDVAVAHGMVQGIQAQMKALHAHLERTAAKAGAAIPVRDQASGGPKER